MEIKLPQAGEKPALVLDAGVHLVKIKEIKPAIDKNGAPMLSKVGGDPAFTFVFHAKPENGEKRYIEQNFYAGKAQWVMDKYIQATGADNSNGPVDVTEIIDKPLWIAVRKKIARINGQPEMKDGKPVAYSEVFDAFKYFGPDKDKPVIDKSALVVYYDKPAPITAKPLTSISTPKALESSMPASSTDTDYPESWDTKGSENEKASW